MRAYRIAYDGRPYYGFQRQPDVPTVEDDLFDALRALDAFSGEKPPSYAAAGRTDAGVSALAQTVALRPPTGSPRGRSTANSRPRFGPGRAPTFPTGSTRPTTRPSAGTPTTCTRPKRTSRWPAKRSTGSRVATTSTT